MGLVLRFKSLRQANLIRDGWTPSRDHGNEAMNINKWLFLVRTPCLDPLPFMGVRRQDIPFGGGLFTIWKGDVYEAQWKKGTVDNSLVHHFLLNIMILLILISCRIMSISCPSTPPSATHVYIVVNGRLWCSAVSPKPQHISMGSSSLQKGFNG